MYETLKDNDLLTSSNILQRQNETKHILSISRFPNQNYDRMIAYAKWWESSAIPIILISDSNNGRERELPLRRALAEGCPGMGLKISSLLLMKCGYQNIAALDLWVLRWLKKEFGFVPSSGKENVTKLSEYLEGENIISKIAVEFDTTTAHVQASIWGKFAAWTPHHQSKLTNWRYHD